MNKVFKTKIWLKLRLTSFGATGRCVLLSSSLSTSMYLLGSYSRMHQKHTKSAARYFLLISKRIWLTSPVCFPSAFGLPVRKCSSLGSPLQKGHDNVRQKKKKTSADMKDAVVGVWRSLTLSGDGLSWTSPSMMRRTASSMSPLAMDRALRASDRPHLGNISSRCCSWASHPPAGGCKGIVKSSQYESENVKKLKLRWYLQAKEMLTLAVAPSVCVFRHCVCLPDGLLLGMFETFTEISSVLALGTLLSLATEGVVTVIKVNKKVQNNNNNNNRETVF